MACLPHIASFTMYVLDHSKSRESCMRFIHESLIKSEEQFFYGSAASEVLEAVAVAVAVPPRA